MSGLLLLAALWLFINPPAASRGDHTIQPAGAAQSLYRTRAPRTMTPHLRAPRVVTTLPRLIAPDTKPDEAHAVSPTRTVSLTHTTRAPSPRLCRAPAVLPPPPGPCGDRWRRAARPNPSGLLAAPPSVSAATIWHALWAAGSPLADDGPRRNGATYAEYVWDAGQRAGIDPAVVMALFRQESRYGTRGMAVLTHNLGNIRPSAGEPSVCGGDGCYAYDADWFAGIDSIYGVLSRYAALGYTTTDSIIGLWAPPSDYNDDVAFSYGVHETLYNLGVAS